MSKIFKAGIIAMAVILGISVFAAYNILKPAQTLPVYGPTADNAEAHKVGSFSLTSQSGQKISNETVKGKIYVADFFFTTCHGICPRMSSQMQRVYEHYKGNQSVLFLSHTVNPGYDSVPVLADYAARHGADAKQWLFLTGDKKEIYDLARHSYLVDASEGNGGAEDFVHTQNFALVDRNLHIRGYYDGTDSLDVDKLIGDIGILLREK
jgi:protein SCO1/2